jgi:metallophosphoesterase (TIGR00282 family)
LPIVVPRSPECLRVVLIGDIVGKPGMRVTCKAIAWLRDCFQVDGIIANAENAADGSGLRATDYRRLIRHGIDAITLGDHIYRKQEIIEVLSQERNIVRPANLPAKAPGLRWTTFKAGEHDVAVLSLLGRVFMKPVDCPFSAADRALEEIGAEARIRIVDFHAEATSDKQLMGRHLDGRVTAVLGTHTHVTTADEQIFSGGTGFQCDVGMTGPMNGILGRKIEPVMRATLTGTPAPFQVSTGSVELHCTWVDADPSTGHCRAIGRLLIAETALDQYLEVEAAAEKVRRMIL